MFLVRIDVDEIDTVMKKNQLAGPKYDKVALQKSINDMTTDALDDFTLALNDLVKAMADISLANRRKPSDVQEFCKAFADSSLYNDFIYELFENSKEFLDQCAYMTRESIGAIEYQNDGFFDYLCPMISFELGALGFVKNAMNISSLLCPLKRPIVSSVDHFGEYSNYESDFENVYLPTQNLN